MPSVPWSPPSTFRTGGDNISRLLMERGRIGADRAAQQGQIWGAAAQNLGQVAGQTVEAVQMAKRDAKWVAYAKSGEWAKDPKAAYSIALQTWGPQEGPRQFEALMAAGQIGQGKPEEKQKRLGLIIGAVERMDDRARAALWPELRALGAQAFPEIPIPEQYDPAYWSGTVSPLGMQIRGEKPPTPEGFTLGAGETRFGPDGKPIATVAPKPVEPPTPSFQAKDVLLDGKPTMVNFDSRTGRYMVGNEDVTMRVSPIPPQPREPRQEGYSWILRPGPDGKATPMRVREGEIRPGDQPYQGPQNQRLTAPERQDFAAMNYALPKLETFTKYVEANPDKWGRWDSFRMGVKQAIPGLADEEYASQEAFITRVNAEIRHALYGASLTGGEQQSAEGFIVNKNDQPARIVAKVKEAMSRARANVDYYRSLGFNVPAPAGGGAPDKRANPFR